MPRRPRRLAELEKDLRDEERLAARWMRRNAHRLPADELPVERVRPVRDKAVEKDARQRRTVLFGGDLLSVGEEVGIVYDERQRFVPMQGRPALFDPEGFVKAERVERTLKDLPVSQRRILMAHHIEGKTLRQLRRARESRQAVYGRLTRAEDAFARAWELHKDDVIDVAGAIEHPEEYRTTVENIDRLLSLTGGER